MRTQVTSILNPRLRRLRNEPMKANLLLQAKTRCCHATTLKGCKLQANQFRHPARRTRAPPAGVLALHTYLNKPHMGTLLAAVLPRRHFPLPPPGRR